MIEDNNSNKAHPQGNIFILGVCYFKNQLNSFLTFNNILIKN